MEGNPTKCALGSALAISLLVVLSGLAVRSSGDQTKGEPVILVVGELGSMRTRNPLPAIAQDIPTKDVLDLVYDAVGKVLPETDALAPYILKGVDVDDDGTFEDGEYGKFEKQDGGDLLNVTAYYDFNGVYFHDGVQATVGDLFFSYQLAAMNPRMNGDLLVLMDKAGRSGSNYSTTRWLFISPAAKSWEDEPQVGNSSLRVAVRFQLQEPFALFSNRTLAGCVLFPRHVWEQTGWRIDTERIDPFYGDKVGPLHLDFGIAIYPESDARFGQGVPMTETTFKPYVYLKSDTPAIDSAEEWQPEDMDVIGTGPFIFEMSNESYRTTRVLKNPLYFVGRDAKTGAVLDSFLSTYINQPFIDGITFTVPWEGYYCFIRMESNRDIDFCRSGTPPEFVPRLQLMWDVRIWSRPDPGFTYLGYNLRRPSVGMWHYGQADGFDVGYHFRKAVAHLIDKTHIVNDFLQGYGRAGLVPITPNNVRFYNASLVGYDFNTTAASAEMDLAHADAVWLAANGGPPEAVTWFTKDPGTGYYILPGIGPTEFNLWCPKADYDPVKANSCALITYEMRRFAMNVRTVSTSTTGLINIIAWHEYDMYVSGWTVSDHDPDYLFDFLHSSRAASGHNYAGFNDGLMDAVLDASRREMNATRRADMFKWAQGIVLDKLPYDTLYFKTNIESTNQGRFIGWKPLHGTVWNFWSLLNIRPPTGMRLYVSIESSSAVTAGESAAVTIKVRDQDGNPVDGALVHATVTPEWAGNLSAGGGPAGNDITATASLGKLVLTYTAPSVDGIYNVTITATATYPQFQEVPESSKSFVIAVYPAAAKFLGVTIQFLDTDIVPTSDTIWFEVSVTDRDGFAVPDSQATAATNPPLEPPYGIEPSQWNGSATSRLRFRAPRGSLMAANQTPIVLTVSADSLDEGTGNASVVFLILRLFITCPDGTQVPTDEECSSQLGAGSYTLVVIVTIVSVGAAAIVSLVVEEWSRRRNVGGGKR
jgi:ABC-type transport system substrate-binding protein